MGHQRKQHSMEFKAKVALEAVKGVQTLGALSARYKVHPTQIAQWKKQLMRNGPQLFARGQGAGAVEEERLTAPLYQEIGRLKMEVDFLQKNAERASVGA